MQIKLDIRIQNEVWSDIDHLSKLNNSNFSSDYTVFLNLKKLIQILKKNHYNIHLNAFY